MINSIFQNKKRIYFILLFGLGLILCLAYYLPITKCEMTQSLDSVHNKHVGEIINNTIIIQEFSLKKNYLYGIDLKLATFNRKNSNSNSLLILDKNYKILFKHNFLSKNIIDNCYNSFIFQKEIYIGKENTFYICLVSKDGESKNSITAWTDSTINKFQLFKSTKIGNEIIKTNKTLLKGSLLLKTYESNENSFIKKIIFFGIIFALILLIFSWFIKSKIPFNKANSSNIIITFIFIIFISVPGIYFYFLKNKNYQFSQRENRFLTQLMTFGISDINKFSANYENYFNDYFPSREKLITIRSLIYYHILKKSPFPSKVTIGKNGWFLKPDERQFIEGQFFVSEQKLNQIVNILHNRTTYYKSIGAKFYIALIPLKSEIYSENLPSYYRIRNKKNITDQFVKTLSRDTFLNIIDLKPTLLFAKKHNKVFSKTDFHWSEIGAYHAYVKIMNRLKIDFPNIEPLSTKDFNLTEVPNITGNQTKELALEGYIDEPFYNFQIFNPKSKEGIKSGYQAPNGLGDKNQFEFVRINKDTTLPRIVVIRDSFFHPLIYLTSEHFSRSVFIWDSWNYGCNKALIEKEKPDIVLLELYIGYLNNIFVYDKGIK